MKTGIVMAEFFVGLIILSIVALMPLGLTTEPVGQDAAILYGSIQSRGVNNFLVDSGIYLRSIQTATMGNAVSAPYVRDCIRAQLIGEVYRLQTATNSGELLWDTDGVILLRRLLSTTIIEVKYEGTSSFIGVYYDCLHNNETPIDLSDGDAVGIESGYYSPRINYDITDSTKFNEIANNADMVASTRVAYMGLNRKPIYIIVYNCMI